jgi:hypothetical protein
MSSSFDGGGGGGDDGTGVASGEELAALLRPLSALPRQELPKHISWHKRTDGSDASQQTFYPAALLNELRPADVLPALQRGGADAREGHRRATGERRRAAKNWTADDLARWERNRATLVGQMMTAVTLPADARRPCADPLDHSAGVHLVLREPGDWGLTASQRADLLHERLLRVEGLDDDAGGGGGSSSGGGGGGVVTLKVVTAQVREWLALSPGDGAARHAAVEPFTVTREDHPARGGRGLRATVRLRPGTMLLQPYAGRVELCAEDRDSPQLDAERAHYADVTREYERRCVSGAVADGAFPGEVQAPPMYDFDLQLVRIEPRAPARRRGGGGAGGGGSSSAAAAAATGGASGSLSLSYPHPVSLLVRGYTVGGVTGFINDARGVPGAAVNATVVEVLLGGVLPLLFVVTTRDVPAGDELFISYGDRYWSGFAAAASRRKLTAMNLRRCVASNVLAVVDATRQLRADAAELEAAAQLLRLRLEIARDQAAEASRAMSRAALAARALPQLERAVQVQAAELARLEAAVADAVTERRAADARAAALRDAAARDARKLRSFSMLHRLLADAVGLMEPARNAVECRFCGKRFSNAHRVRNHGTDCEGYRRAVQAHGVLRCATHLYHELDFPPGFCDDDEYLRHVRILSSAVVDAQLRGEVDAAASAQAAARPAAAPAAAASLSAAAAPAPAVELLDDGGSADGDTGGVSASSAATGAPAGAVRVPANAARATTSTAAHGDDRRDGHREQQQRRWHDDRDTGGSYYASDYARTGVVIGGGSSSMRAAGAPPGYAPYGAPPPPPPPPPPQQQHLVFQQQWPPVGATHSAYAEPYAPPPLLPQPHMQAHYPQPQYPHTHAVPQAVAPLYGGGVVVSGSSSGPLGGAYDAVHHYDDEDDDHFKHLQQMFGGGAGGRRAPAAEEHAGAAAAAPAPPQLPAHSWAAGTAPPPFAAAAPSALPSYFTMAAPNVMTNAGSADSAPPPSGARLFSWEERR